MFNGDIKTGKMRNDLSDITICLGKSKGKAMLLQARTGPEVSRRLRLPDFKKIST
jgi:hypothetical protein